MMEIDRFPIPQIPCTPPLEQKDNKNKNRRNKSFRNLRLNRDGGNATQRATSDNDLRRRDCLVKKTSMNKNRKTFSFPNLFSTKRSRNTSLPQTAPKISKDTKNNLDSVKHPYVSESESENPSFKWKKSHKKFFRRYHFRKQPLNITNIVEDSNHEPQASQMIKRLPRPYKNDVIPNLLPKEDEELETNDDNMINFRSNAAKIGSEGDIKPENLSDNKMSDDYNDFEILDDLDKYLDIAMSPENLDIEILSKDYRQKD